MNGTELRTFSHYQILTKIACPYLVRNHENSVVILKFAFIQMYS